MRVLLIGEVLPQHLALDQGMDKAIIAAEVVTAVDAEEGLALAKKQRFDSVLLYHSPPHNDALKALAVLRYSGIESTAIFVLSDKEDDRLAEQCVAAGAQDFLLTGELIPRRLQQAISQFKQCYSMELELQRSREMLKDLAENDQLTRLTNRFGFEAYLHRSFALAQRQNSSIAVILIDLDDFKSINETYGHHYGDIFLKTVAERLLKCVRSGDMLARLSADEFVLLATNIACDNLVSALVKRLRDTVTAPIRIGSAEISTTASVGVATSSVHAAHAGELLGFADIAMHRSKSAGPNQIHYYSDALHQKIRARTELENELRNALQKGQLQLHYQPQVCAKTRNLVGMEALLRWQHPARGLLLPGDFLAVAEQCGLIAKIGAWALETACKQLMEWRALDKKHNATLKVAVNLSALQLKDQSLIRVVKKALKRSGLPPQCLELEVTENALIEQPKLAALSLRKLSECGVRLALDDFGTGYSSLQHLKHFPVDTLKIDRSFIAALGEDIREEKMISAVIRFAQILAIKTIAEGIETEGQYQLCQGLGCDYLQGYYFARPIPAEEFTANFLDQGIGAEEYG